MFENYGESLEAVITLSVVGEGFPMMYNGQEAGNDKRLAFFEKDPIKWRQHPIGDLYKTLFTLKHSNEALWNGQFGGRMIHVTNSAPKEVLSFVREKNDDKIFALFNFSDKSHTVTFEEQLFVGQYADVFTGQLITLDKDSEFKLPAWGYRVFKK